MTIFRIVNNQFDVNLLRFDLDMLYKLCNINLITVNIKNCRTMTISRRRSYSIYNYYNIENELLPQATDFVKDLLCKPLRLLLIPTLIMMQIILSKY